MKKYEDFEMVISKIGDADVYSVSVRQPNAGDADSSFTEGDIKNLALPAAATANAGNRNFRPVSDGQEYILNYAKPLNDANAKTFGLSLFKILFRNDVLQLLGKCEQICREKNSILRIRLDLSRAPDLAEIPWEYLRTPDNSNFISMDDDFTLVRYLQTADAFKPLKVFLPLRILVMASTPDDLPALAVNVEIENIKTAVKNLDSDKINVEILTESTVSALENALERAQEGNEPFHIFHYIGHGAFDEQNKEGVLVFEDANKHGVPIGHEQLGRLLQPFRTDLRLVILNACESAKISATSIYSSVAAKIMQIAELPAVVAMQYSVSDNAAIRFSQKFYQQISADADLEKAVDEARKLMNTEFATPVIYLRAENGHLFDLKIPAPPRGYDYHFTDVKNNLLNNELVVFLGLDINNREIPYKPNFPPSVNDIREKLCEALKINPPNGSLSELATLFKLTNQPSAFSAIFQQFFTDAAAPLKLYDILAGFAKTTIASNKAIIAANQAAGNSLSPPPASFLVVTTTYDSLLEKAYRTAEIEQYHVISYNLNQDGNCIFKHLHYRNGVPVIDEDILAANEYKNLRDEYPVILKLPGEIKQRKRFAVTEDDFIAFAQIPPSRLIPADILGRIKGSSHLYIGYNLKSWTLRLLHNWICENRNPDTFNFNYYAHTSNETAGFWTKLGVSPISVDLEDYVEGLDQLVLQKLEN